ncbi:MAG TPA: pitrilysin family protein [Gemmatimonadaceae bacterium]|nr:pitrilysin family protein [Gemmatimonadaceae bacterium]
MLTSRSFIAVAALSLLPAIAPAQMSPAASATRESLATIVPDAGDVLPFKATEATLPNGLKVIVVPTGFPNIVSIQIPVQTGSRNEVEPGKSGFAHFFEHMMFRGTPRYSPEKFTEIMTRAGARNNASTSDDRTMYYATFAKDDLEQIIELMGDNFQNLKYAEPEFKTEAKAVLGEYNKNASEPGFKLFELTRKTAFGTHTYGHTTMGFIEDIENMPNQFEYSKQFFDRWYRPEYTAIVVAGDVTAEQVLPLIRKHWGGWKPGSYKASIPAEPPSTAPKYAHAVWATPTNPLISVAFRNPAFSETIRDNAALDLVAGIYFGPTSDIYRKLVVTEQKLDSFGASNSSNVDPGLFRITARLKDPKDAVYVRDEILRTVNRARTELVPDSRLADAKSAERYAFVRSLDNTGSIAATVAEYVKYSRSYSTLNSVYRLYAALTPEDLRGAAARYFTDENLVVTSLSNTALPAALAQQPPLGSFAATATAAAPAAGDDAKRALKAKLDAIIARDMRAVPPKLPKLDIIEQKSQLPQIAMKLAFNAGSAYDPPGKEGLAALSAAMISGAGSRELTISEIRQLLYPMAGSFTGSVDKELATFTASIHKDNWHEFLHIVLDQLAKPGFRADDFQRLRDRQLIALTQDLRSNNEEELGKERLQTNIFAGTPYGHPALGTVAGIKAITLDDVRAFVRDHYTLGDLKVGLSGDVPTGFTQVTSAILASLPAGRPAPRPVAFKGKRPRGMEVEIIRKDTRSTAISFGHPIAVTRSHPDFAALNVARSYLGEHRMSNAHLYQRIRAVRGMNYGDYAYIEAFPGGMFRFFPSPNIVRRNQLFEVWIRPVEPQNAHMALRIANAELRRLIDDGISQADFEDTRDYLMKNVYVMTATQDAQLGYALDSKWYGTGEFTRYMRNALSKLTRQQVNDAIRRHLSATDLSVVIITRDADGLRDALVSDAFSPIRYDSEKPAALLAEDKVIGARKLSIKPENVKITAVEEVFAR